MAGDVNSVVLVGRLTRESEIRYSQGGGVVVRFSIAINRRKRTGDNRWEDEVNYFDCVYFGKAAEAVNQYLEKGRQVAIQGELRQNKWEQDGQSRSRVEIMVNTLQLLGGSQGGARDNGDSYQSQPRNSAPSRGQNGGQYSPRPQNNAPIRDDADFNVGPETYADDDVPF